MAQQNNENNRQNNEAIDDEKGKLLEYQIRDRVEEKLLKRYKLVFAVLAGFLGLLATALGLLGWSGLRSLNDEINTIVENYGIEVVKQQEDFTKMAKGYKDDLKGDMERIEALEKQVIKAEDDLKRQIQKAQNLGVSVKRMKTSLIKLTGDLEVAESSVNALKREASELGEKYAVLKTCPPTELAKSAAALNKLSKESKEFIGLHNDLEKIKNVIHIDEKNVRVGIGSKQPIDLEVSEDLKFAGRLDLPDSFGWTWHEAVAKVNKKQTWATAIDHDGPGILQFVQAYGGKCAGANKLEIFIDGEIWKNYSGHAHRGHTNGWDKIDDENDDDAGIVVLMPFKKFSRSLRVRIYNAKKGHESSVRVNFLTPKEMR